MAHAIVRTMHVGAQKNGEMFVFGRAFKLKWFGIGSAGHDPKTLLPVVPDPTLTALPSPVTGSLLEIATGAAYQVSPTVTEFKLTLPAGVGSGVFSSIGIYGEITSVVDEADAGLIGQVFLYGIANLPMQNKLDSESKTLTLRLNNI